MQNQPGDVVGIGIHTGNALRGYEVGRAARARGATVVFGGIHATLYPEEAQNLLQVMRVRVLARQLYLEKVEGFDGRCRFTLVGDSGGRFGMPEGFLDRLLRVLFSIQAPSGRYGLNRVRLLPDGFELDTGTASPREVLGSVQRTLETLCALMGGADAVGG